MTKKTYILSVIIIFFSAFASSTGIFSNHDYGIREFLSVNGEKVLLYGTGIYHNMSADVAPQGIAQDYVTLFIAIPLLLFSLLLAAKGSIKWKLFLTGVTGYFLVTYLFYLMMGMYNELYLVYVILLGCSFYNFVNLMLSLNKQKVKEFFNDKVPVKFTGGFLIFNSIAISFLWLGVVVPPLFAARYPLELQHYTTLVVQGLDLAVLLPASFISGLLLFRKTDGGFLLAPVYFVFLSILMTALTGKVISMWMVGVNVFPVIIIIPLFNLLTIICAFLLYKKIRNTGIMAV